MAREGRSSRSGLLVLLVTVAAVALTEILWQATGKWGQSRHSSSFTISGTGSKSPAHTEDLRRKRKIRSAGRDGSRVTLRQQADSTKTRNIFDLSRGLVIDSSGSTAEEEETSDDRKCRSAIESLARNQENLRMTTRLGTGKTMFAAVTTLLLAITASATATIPLWYQVLLPAVTSGLFVQTSMSESKGTEVKGLARHHSGQAVVFASQQAAVLAQAEVRKAYLPFGIGVTAIFASACVSLKLFNEKMGDLIPEDKLYPPLLAADNFLMIFFAVASIIGAMRASETYLNMRTALTFKKEDSQDEEGSAQWEAKQLPMYAPDISSKERLLVNVLSFLASLLPLVISSRGLVLGIETAAKSGVFNKEFQEFIDSSSVVVSAAAGAQAAIIFLIAELEFADAERRVAIQGRQAGLSELFFAQTQAEFAAMPAKSAWSGMMLAVASLAVEYSAIASGFFPWPAMLGSMKAFVSANLAGSSAEASWLQRKLQKTGRPTGKQQDTFSTSTREVSRWVKGIISKNELPSSVRQSLISLPVGNTKVFAGLNSESRRKVHVVAAELGMVSQSIQEKRSVAVTNFGGAKIDTEEPFAPESLAKAAQGVLISTQQAVVDIAERGIPSGEEGTIQPALVATAAGVVAPFVLGEAGADFAIPLLTGGVSLATVWQEQSGKGTVGNVKETVARIRTKIAKAESLFGRATISAAVMPTYLAIATAATTASVVFFMESTPTRLWWVNAMLLGITLVATRCAARRQKRIAFYITQASQTVGGTPPPRDWVSSRRWWIVPISIALAVPCDLPRRLTLAMGVLATEIGIMMSSTFTQMAAAGFYAARAQRVFARADAWASQASSESRALPKNSAAAISTTLLAIALVAFDTPLGGIFPVAAMGVCLQAVQSRFLASRTAKRAEIEASDIQRIGTDAPPFLQRAAQTEKLGRRYVPTVKPVQYTSSDSTMLDDALPSITADLQREFQSLEQLFEMLSEGNEEITWPTFRAFFEKFNNGKLTQQQIERLWLAFDTNLSGGVDLEELEALLGKRFGGKRGSKLINVGGAVTTLTKGALVKAGAISPDDYYVASAAQKAVTNVQTSLSELRLSVKSSEKNWLRTGAVVGTAATAAILAPFLLSEVLTEVLLPVVGAALVLFAVDAEADTRSKIASAKVWAAELNEIASTQEELLAIGGLYKARLISIAALSVCIAISTIVLEEPFGIFEIFPHLQGIQNIIRWGLIVMQAVNSIWSVGRYLTVLEWTDRVNKSVIVTTKRGSNANQEETPKSWFQGRRESGPLDRRLPLLLAVLPVVLLTIFPWGRHFGKRAVASTAAGAAVVALALYSAERAVARAELSQAARMRSFAMADVFCELAEQQGAVLPFISAATIAVAGVITFATEVNPIFAAGLTILQALGWIVASKKGVAAKFESQAALKVNLNTTTPRINPGKDPVNRIKRFFMN